MQNILLINPKSPDFLNYNNVGFPISLLYLASVLNKIGKRVIIVDYGVGDQIPKNFIPDLIGITCLFSGRLPETLRLSKKLKQKYNCPIILGGIHPTIFAKDILKNHSDVDYICLGEGEDLICQLTEDRKMEEINGLVYRHDNRIIANHKTYIVELDKIPFSNYSMINLQKYHYDTEHFKFPRQSKILPFPIVSSRSCPNRCNFCAMFHTHGPKWRPRSAKNVVDEIEFLHKTYNQRYFLFIDDNLTFSKKRTKQIAQKIIDRKLDIKFDTPNGVSIKTLDEETLDLLVQAGLEGICVAPESGSDYIRNKVIGKKLSSKQIYDFFNYLRKYPKLFVRSFFVIGFPEETKETLIDTYKMVEKLSDRIDSMSLFYAVPFPGTKLFNQCKQEKLIVIDDNNLYNNMTFSNYNDSDVPMIKPYGLELNELKNMRRRIYSLLKHNY